MRCIVGFAWVSLAQLLFGSAACAALPTVAKSFAPATVAQGANAVWTITLGNPNADPATLTQDFRATLPEGVLLASTPVVVLAVVPEREIASANPATTCTGSVVAEASDPGSQSRPDTVVLPAGSVLPPGGCTITATVTSSNRATYVDPVPEAMLQTTLGNNAAGGGASLAVVPSIAVTQAIAAATPVAPTAALAPVGPYNFELPASANASYSANGGGATLTVRITNAGASALAFALTDLLPADLHRSSTPTSTCTAPDITTGTVAGRDLIELGASVPANATCALSFNVTPLAANTTYVNTIAPEDFVATNGALAAPVSARYTVGTPAEPSIATRAEAADAAATGAAACTAVQPFYWEIGDRNAVLARGNITTGSRASMANTTPYSATRSIPLASASKWPYSAYVHEKRAGLFTDQDVALLNFTSGHKGQDFTQCTGNILLTTIQACHNWRDNGGTTAYAGRFDYGGGHLQVHAHMQMTSPDMSPLKGKPNLLTYYIPADASLAQEIRGEIDPGTVFGSSGADLVYQSPQPAGGGYMSPGAYGRFLRRILDGTLRHTLVNLGSYAVNTNPNVYPEQAVSSPWLGAGGNGAAYDGAGAGSYPEDAKYGLAHWIEDDLPDHGDGAFSSGGAYGFYPWIDRDRTWYGLVARAGPLTDLTASVDSARCGRAIRAAWTAGAYTP